MTRKLTALFLLWLMSVVIATSQPGLSYCLCLQQVLIGECPCLDTCHEEPESNHCDDHSCECSTEDTTALTEILSTPNPGCLISLRMELDSFASPDANSTLSFKEKLSAPFIATPHAIDTPFSLARSLIRIPESPPPVLAPPSVPLRLRYSVFLV